MLEASWRTADAVVAQKTRQTGPKDFWVGLLAERRFVERAQLAAVQAAAFGA